MARRKSRYSGIGGQAVLEGVMMKNKEKYAVAVRKPDGEIEVEVETYQGLAHGSKIKELPFIRGIFNFLDSLLLGTRALNYSASFYEEEDSKETKFDKAMDKMSGGNGEKLLSGIVTVISVVLAVGLFIVLPYFISSLFESFIRNRSLMSIIEGVIRIALFLLYVWGISAMKDIRRLYQYHGAEHKCINCIEKGRPLTVHNVMHSSRLHKRCGTSFIFFVMLVSIVGTNKKTAQLVDNITTAMNLELTVPGAEGTTNVPLTDTEVYNIADSMTIPLKSEAGAKQDYIMFDVSLSINKKSKDYKTYGSSETLSGYENLIKDAITATVSAHTEDECREDMEGLKEEILKSVQDLFQSDFIYKVAISGVKFG